MQSQHLCLAHIQYEVTGKITCCKDEWQYLHLLIPLSILSEHITAVCTGVKTDFWCCIGLVLYSGIKLVFILISHPQCLSLKVLNISFGKKKTNITIGKGFWSSCSKYHLLCNLMPKEEVSTIFEEWDSSKKWSAMTKIFMFHSANLLASVSCLQTINLNSKQRKNTV